MTENRKNQPDWSKAHWVDPALGWTPLPVPELPGRVLMDFATRCNLRCPMCPVWGAEEGDIQGVKGIMDLDGAIGVLDQLAPARPMVQPNMYGEPLLIPQWEKVLQALKDRDMEVTFNTNGLTLCRRIAENLPEGYRTPVGDGRCFGEALLAPSLIYVAFVRECQRRGLKLNYLAHVTGHGWRPTSAVIQPAVLAM